MRRHEEDEIMVIESDSGAGVKWFLLGALVGAGLGLLFAPESGERTRRKITREAKRLRREAEGRWDELREEVVDKGRQLKSDVEEWTDGVRESVTEGVKEGRRVVERKANSARDDLERRLADARARRRAAVGADGVADEDGDDA